ncbi:hypothetical protein [Vibrio genomosp. F10]|uniref:hypothetical protein n=1 Tax=Vibrio genomosp. F10 TaxID=723171 RepID=UPI000304213C|nr:hypothetical protein [Vibrio genomosp. F10]OEE90742.1 hypothetical protein A1QK_18390 [Vibrio genomosp. F10 str. 9ZD137]
MLVNKYVYSLFMLSLVATFSSASELIIENIGNFIFGKIDGDLATNFDSNGNFRSLKWLNGNDEVISEKAYYIIENNRDEIRLCIDNHTPSCVSVDDYMTQKSPKDTISNNIASLDVVFLNYDDLAFGVSPVSYSNFSITQGEFSFLYMENIDQDGFVTDNKIDFDYPNSLLVGKPILDSSTSIKTCSIGGYKYGEPTYIEACSDEVIFDKQVSLSITKVSDGLEQGRVPISFEIKVDEPLNQDLILTLNYSGSARQNSDYTPKPEVTLKKGTNNYNLLIPVVDDSILENNESVTITLSSDQLESSPKATGYIYDNDTPTYVNITVKTKCWASPNPFSPHAKLWTYVTNNSGHDVWLNEPHKGKIKIKNGASNKEIDFQETREHSRSLNEHFEDDKNDFYLPHDSGICKWNLGHDANGEWSTTYVAEAIK